VVKEFEISELGNITQNLYRVVVFAPEVISSVGSASIRKVRIYTLVEQPVKGLSRVCKVSDRQSVDSRTYWRNKWLRDPISNRIRSEV
jgi:hypothetical protein